MQVFLNKHNATPAIRVSLIVFSLFALESYFVGCGRDSGGVDKPSEVNSTNGEVPCTQSDCPHVPLNIQANPVENGVLTATIHGGEKWRFVGLAQGGSTRDVRMKAFNPPVGGSFTNQGTLNIGADYKSLEAVQSKAPILVTLRDISRCKFLKKDQESSCDNLDIPMANVDYEITANYNWQIREGNIDDYVDPSFTGDQAPLMGANAGMTGCTQGFMTGAVGGLQGGSILPAILGGTIGCFGTSFGNLSQ